MFKIGPAVRACFFLYSGESLSSLFWPCPEGFPFLFAGGGFFATAFAWLTTRRGAFDAAKVTDSGEERLGYDKTVSRKGVE